MPGSSKYADDWASAGSSVACIRCRVLFCLVRRWRSDSRVCGISDSFIVLPVQAGGDLSMQANGPAQLSGFRLVYDELWNTNLGC